VEVPRVEYDRLADDRLGEASATIRARIEKAREVQRQRFAGRLGGAEGNVPLLCNAEMPAPMGQAQVWARARCASTARSMTLARACPWVPLQFGGTARRDDGPGDGRLNLTQRPEAEAHLHTVSSIASAVGIPSPATPPESSSRPTEAVILFQRIVSYSATLRFVIIIPKPCRRACKA
jgi:hypothetical protein